MSKRSLVVFVGILWVIGGLIAQPKPVKPQSLNDPLAEKYLKILRSKLETSKGYKFYFTLTSTNADNKSTTEKGIYTGAGTMYKVELSDNITSFDGKMQWVIDKDAKEIHINKVTPSKNSKAETPIDIIKQYDKLFKYRVKEQESGGIIVLELVPINKNAPYFKVDVAVNTKNSQITYSKLYDKGGNRILFQFTKNEELKTVSTSIFQINTAQYPNYEVLDMR